MFSSVAGQKIDLSAGSSSAVTQEEAAANCQYMRLKIETMPFLTPFNLQEPSILYVGCRSLYGKYYREKMISSAESFSNLLRDELLVIAAPCQEEEAVDSIRLSGAVSTELIQIGLERLEMLTSEIIQ